jgi:hypothetical protein
MNFLKALQLLDTCRELLWYHLRHCNLSRCNVVQGNNILLFYIYLLSLLIVMKHTNKKIEKTKIHTKNAVVVVNSGKQHKWVYHNGDVGRCLDDGCHGFNSNCGEPVFSLFSETIIKMPTLYKNGKKSLKNEYKSLCC